MKGFWLCLLSVLLILLSSCNNNAKTIPIEWVILCDMSRFGFFERPIRLEFMNESGRRSSFRLRPQRTNEIRLQRNMWLSAMEWSLFSEMFIYPLDVPGMDIWDAEMLEIFLFHPLYLEDPDDNIILVPHEKILFYFYSFIEGCREYFIFSRSNKISLDFENMTRIDADMYTGSDRIFEIMQKNNLDSGYFYHDSEDAFFLLNLEDGNAIPLSAARDSTRGVLVESRVSNTGFRLLTNRGIWLED